MHANWTSSSCSLSQTMVRERASMLLSACLDIIKAREKSPTETYRKIFEEARSVLVKAGPTDAILGSLLAFGSMLQNQHIVSLPWAPPGVHESY